MPSREGTTSRIYPSSIRRSRCSSGIVRWLGRFLTSCKEANSSAVRRGLFRNEGDKWFLIGQICGVSKNVGLGGLSEQRPASSPSPVQGPNRIKHRLSFGLVFSCQGFCNLCQPRVAPANQTILTAAEFMSRLCASMCRSAFCRDDCFGSLALITARSRDVCLTPESDLKIDVWNVH